MDNSREVNLFANIGAILFNLFLGVRLFVQFRKANDERFRETFLVVVQTLVASMAGGVLFLVMYLLRLLGVIDDYTLQGLARLTLLFFYFFVPSLIYFSMQNLK